MNELVSRPATRRPLFRLVLALAVLALARPAQAVGTVAGTARPPASPGDGACGSSLGQDAACNDGRTARLPNPNAPQPAPNLAPSAGTWDEYVYSGQNSLEGIAKQFQTDPNGNPYGQMNPQMGQIAATQGGAGLARASATQPGTGGTAGGGGMGGWLAALGALAAIASIAGS